MKTLKSYTRGAWHEARNETASGFTILVNPSTEEPIARASSAGLDFQAMLAFARDRGGPALRALTFGERGEMLKAMSKALRDHRGELLELSARNSGTTSHDGGFDIDGGTGTLGYYAGLAKGLGARRALLDGEDIPLMKTEAFYGQHLLVPRRGVAVHINAFNFPLWGFAEKAACALLAGVAVITKPATATAAVTERAFEILIAAQILPEGALQLVCGSTGDLLSLLGAQDVFAFTGSADTALKLRSGANLLAANTRVNLEADSLNAAVLGPDVAPGTPAWELFLKDVVREMTQKSGQKCTAVRRILVPADRGAAVEAALIERLAAVVTGNPTDSTVTMGPLATAQQLRDAEGGLMKLQAAAKLVHGAARRSDGTGSPAGKGYFLTPTLLRVEDARAAAVVHAHEVFAPVATQIHYAGGATDAAEIVALGGGTLVTSVYSDDSDWTTEFIRNTSPFTGRIYIGSAASAGEAPGSGMAMPQTLHGGPGRAGGGEELAGPAGLRPYLQKVALQGSRTELRAIAERM
ncbi:MAG: 3,4-dehydroadipyl-CoA semialdehyde dehydrogenase [Acidobacteriota bacterium]